MKNLFIFLVIVAVGYFAYKFLIEKKPVLDVKASRSISTSYSDNIHALYPSHSGAIEGTAKNVSDEVVNNILLKYVLDGKPVEASISRLQPGEEQHFITQQIKVRSESPAYFLDEMIYE